MLGTHFYHEIIRKTIIGFGTLFNNVELQRTDSAGNVTQTTKVPLNYGPREKFLARIEAEPDLDGRAETQITLPRMSFEMKGIQYDPTRKLGPIQLCRAEKEGDTKKSYQTYSPVPYNIEFELNILSKNNEDSVQILEQILPYFQPVFNITINLISKMSEKKDIPIVLNSVGIQDDYEADFLTRRTLIHTLSFTAKSYLYGPVSTADVIRKVNVDISAAMETGSRYVRYSATPAAKTDQNRDGTSIDFTAFNVASNTITLGNHGFITGDKVTYNSDPSGQPAGGLTDKTNYFIIKIDNDSFRLAKSKSYARQGFAVDITTQGAGGDHKFSVINEADHAFVEPDDDFGFNESFTTY
tara:strand:+ start:805 stop:1869 length:1065 start_codon:yes stop_codon:yes gene_type:complete